MPDSDPSSFPTPRPSLRKPAPWHLVACLGLAGSLVFGLASTALAQTAGTATGAAAESAEAHAQAVVDAPPPAEIVLDRFVRATGSSEARNKLQNRRSMGSMTFDDMGISGKLEALESREGNTVLRIDSDAFGRVASGVWGEVAWESSDIAGPRLLKGAEKNAAVRESVFDPFENWRAIYESVETLGWDEVEGKKAVKVSALPEGGGEPELLWFEDSTGLLLKEESVTPSAMGDMRGEVLVGDYQLVDGVLIPFKIRNRLAGTSATVTFDSVEHNVELPAQAFEPPGEIQELIEVEQQDEAGDV